MLVECVVRGVGGLYRPVPAKRPSAYDVPVPVSGFLSFEVKLKPPKFLLETQGLTGQEFLRLSHGNGSGGSSLSKRPCYLDSPAM